VLLRDDRLKKAATWNGFLSVDDAASHVVHCWNYHSRLVHANDFSSYEFIPVFHHLVLKNGYTRKELIDYLEHQPSGGEKRALDIEGTVAILIALAKHANFNKHEYVRYKY
jgi:hypothetical protein